MKFVLVRLAQLVIVLLVATFFTYSLTFVANSPEEVVDRVLQTESGNETRRAEIRADLNLDDPLLSRYGKWLGDAITGDFGFSYAAQEPVSDRLTTRIPRTLALVLLSQFLALRKGGSILEQVNPVKMVQMAADHVGKLCDEQHNAHPEVEVINQCKGASLMLPPQYLYYVLIELMKNSMQAMMKQRLRYKDADILQVVVCSDADRVVIAIRDKGGGIPLEEMKKIWSDQIGTTYVIPSVSEKSPFATYRDSTAFLSLKQWDFR